MEFRRPPPPPPPSTPPSLHTVVPTPPRQTPRSASHDLVHLPPPQPPSAVLGGGGAGHNREFSSLSSPRRQHVAKNDYVDSPVATSGNNNHGVVTHPATGTIFNGCGGGGNNGGRYGGGNREQSDFVEVRLPITQQPNSGGGGGGGGGNTKHNVINTQPKKHSSSPHHTQLMSLDEISDTGSAAGQRGGVAGGMNGTNGGAGGAGNSECKASIYCPHCQKCRCGQCTERKELPATWLCNNKLECSCQRCVDITSCLCAVRCVFYHSCSGADGDTSVSPSDEPCACCEQAHCLKRWSCMGAMSLLMPCLCLYWPLQCCHNFITWQYNRCCRRNGCRCQRSGRGHKGLLLDSESSSA